MKVSTKKGIKLLVFSVVLFILLLIVSFEIANRPKSYNSPQARIMRTKVALETYRRHINRLHQENDAYPESLQDISLSPEDFDLLKDFISSVDGNGNQSQSLNGNGGWYYNSETGEIRLNITKPILECLPDYKGDDKNEIPSDW